MCTRKEAVVSPWITFVQRTVVSCPSAEPQAERAFYSKAQLKAVILAGAFRSAKHIPVVPQSVVHGHFSF